MYFFKTGDSSSIDFLKIFWLPQRLSGFYSLLKTKFKKEITCVPVHFSLNERAAYSAGYPVGFRNKKKANFLAKLS